VIIIGDTYISILSWRNPAVNRIMILGVFIHNRKFKMDHKRFFENFYDVNKDILKRG
jgi:hypothetical protein